MKVVILAGGFGTRLSEETSLRPKPMVEIGGKPILWHIMKLYSHHGFNEFIICLGYKGYMIKEYFSNYLRHESDLTIDFANNKTHVHSSNVEPWKVTLIHTGVDTMTGGRIKRIREYTEGSTFMLTYGDGLSNVDIQKLLEFHHESKKSITVTAVQPVGRFGALSMSTDNTVSSFVEKPQGDGMWINGGFFVCEQEVFDYIEGDPTIFEKNPLENLAADQKMIAYKHQGFWKPMDTLRDKTELEKLWQSGSPPWKTW